MSIGMRNERGYLKVTASGHGFFITALKKHASELEALFRQHGVPCSREPGPGRDTLVFGPAADRDKVEEVLLGYEAANGS